MSSASPPVGIGHLESLRTALAKADALVFWGAGAIGGTIAAYLARARRPVLAVDVDEAHVAAIRAGGLRITGPLDEFVVPVAAATPGEITALHAAGDLGSGLSSAFLCVKAQATDAAMDALAPLLAPQGFVVSLQNGLNELAIARVVGRDRTVGGFVNFGADWQRPGEILYGGRGAVVVGELDGRTSARVQRIAEALRLFDPATEITDRIFGYKWGKLAYGALLFATALTHETMADALADARWLPLWRALAGEIVRVAVASGTEPLGFNGFDPAAFQAGAPEALARRSAEAMSEHNRHSAKQRSGVWRDLAVRKRKTEAEAQIGEVVRIARRRGADAPITARLVAMIVEIEDGKRTMTLDNLQELMQFANTLAKET